MIVFDSWQDPRTLKRAWCVWEILGVALAKQEIEIALTEQQARGYISAIKSSDSFGEVVQSLVAIDVAKAECSSEKDLKIIHDAIKRGSSFSEVNDMVLGKLREWHVFTIKKALEEGGTKPTLNRAFLLNSLGQIMKTEVRCSSKYRENVLVPV